MVFKSTGKRGLFDEQNAIDMMSEMGNPLERLKKVIDFEMFRPLLEERLRAVNRKNNAGARPFDYVMMFKIMILQRLFGLSDKQVQYQITDRLSFKEFLGLSSGDKVPDEKSVWLFREKLTKDGVVEELFAMFHNHLSSSGLIVNEGKMVDASFTTAPRQRNTPDENKKIKNGEGDELWNDKPHKKRQKDVDARWTKKGGDKFYGYKNHAKVDTKSKLIDGYVVTDASVHDSQPLDDLLCENDRNQDFHADSAYTGENQDATIAKYGLNNKVCEKGYRNKPLSDEQKASNREKSKIRARVEHVFGFMEQTMQGLHLRSIGLDRAKGIIGLINLTYNLCRFEQIVRLKII
ncbi:MAG: IS5 family transposase [Rikenellaceae bacterium]